MANSSIKKSARKYLPVILCAFMLIPAHAQKKGYSRGYIITNEGESAEIQGYGMNNQQFESMPLREESSFFNFRYYLDEGNDRVFLKSFQGQMT
jgi:hypothetical protein